MHDAGDTLSLQDLQHRLTISIAHQSLLSNLPLRISPSISLPRAPTLPYTYAPLPHSLPPSSTPGPTSEPDTVSANASALHRFVVAPNSRHAAHPEEIIQSCRKLMKHIEDTEARNQNLIEEWERKLKEEEVLEKRRRAPGWLDRDEKLLEPEKRNTHGTSTTAPTPDLLSEPVQGIDQIPFRDSQASLSGAAQENVGQELDRAFGGLDVR